MDKMYIIAGQNVYLSKINSLIPTDKPVGFPTMNFMTTSDGQNDPLVYNKNIKEYKYKKNEELNSSSLDSHNAHPENRYTQDIFSGVYTRITNNRRRSLEELENIACKSINAS